jgi:hypothetical protein
MICAKSFGMCDKKCETVGVRLGETLSLSEAARVLKFDSFRSVNELIRTKKLRAFKTPFSRNKRVLKSELEALTVMEEVK